MSPVAPQTTRVGGDDGGFSIMCASGGAELRLECWGFWSPEVAAAFVRASVPACESAALSLNVVLDATSLKPQSNDGQESLRALMRALAKKSVISGSMVADNTLTRMQLTRLAKECGVNAKLRVSDGSHSAPPTRGR